MKKDIEKREDKKDKNNFKRVGRNDPCGSGKNLSFVTVTYNFIFS